jgi:aspartate/methionine/tyrosine aminotransferase
VRVTISLIGKELTLSLSTTGTFVIADEVYERLFFGNNPNNDVLSVAPSFLDISRATDRLVVINNFSKMMMMTVC